MSRHPESGAALDRRAARSARVRFRNAENAGHSARCAVVWGIMSEPAGCDCPGRAAIVGRERAAEMDAIEELRRQELREAEGR